MWDLKWGFRSTLATTGWQAARSQRISSGFYTSHAWEWTRR
jgi:magnesium-protoporphyrin O-methyltransferase